MSLLTLLSGSGGGGTAPSLSGVQAGGDYSTAGGTNKSATSAAMTTTAGRGLVAVAVWQDNSATPTLSDSKGNGAWTAGTLRVWTQYGTPVYIQWFLLPSMATAGASHTVTLAHSSGADSFPTMAVFEVSNPGGTLGIDSQSFNTDSTSPYTSSLTSSAADVLMLAGTSPSNSNQSLPFTGDASGTGWAFIYGRSAASLWNLAAFSQTVAVAGATAFSATYNVAQDAELHGINMLGIKATGGTVSASLAWTEADDAAALSGTATVSGTAAWTEANDAAALSGTVGTAVAGSIAWTEANDTAALTGSAQVSGTVAWTEANDAASIAGSATVTGAAAWVEANDVAALTGSVGTLSVSGAIAWAEANDTWQITGTSAAGTPDTGNGGGADPSETRRPLPESTQGLQIRRAPRAKADAVIPASEEVSEIQTPPAAESATRYVAAQRQNPAMAEAMARIRAQIAAARQAEADRMAAAQVERDLLAAQQAQTEALLVMALEQQRRQADDELALLVLLSD